tara:strand:- start:531 stop:779 length:249 start_codon:yes stop_codon:yes gene_type:complete
MFNDKGKPEASPGNHDDMIFAASLALMGLDQIDTVEQTRQVERPRNVKEMLQFEMATGRLYSDAWEEFSDSSEFEDSAPSTF